MTTANDILMGAGVPSAKFAEGVTHAGRIIAISEPYQEREYDPTNPGGGAPKFYPKSGDPIMTFNVDIVTEQRDPSISDDDGTRRIYMDGKRIKDAVRTGIKASGAPGLAIGGFLSITCTGYDTPGDIRSGKNYSVQYTPGAAANNVLMGAPATNPAPQAQAPQAQAFIPQPAPDAAPAPTPAATAGPTPEQVAALRAAGIDPTVVYPGYTG